MNRRNSLRLGLGALLATSGVRRSWAGYPTCAGKPVEDDLLRCPDGTIPSYSYGNRPLDTTGTQKPKQLDRHFTGIWHTDVPGVSFRYPFDIQGASYLSSDIGTGAGDITIAPNGHFVWNTLRGAYGPWVLTEPGSVWQFIATDELTDARWRGNVVDGKLHLTTSGGQSVTAFR